MQCMDAVREHRRAITSHRWIHAPRNTRSKKYPIGFERLTGLNHALSPQDLEIPVCSQRWLFERLSLSPRGRNDHGRFKVEKIVDELVGMLRLDAIRRQHLLGKVLPVERHDHAGVAADCSGKHVTIIGIRKNKPGNQRFITGHDGIGYRSIHQT